MEKDNSFVEVFEDACAVVRRVNYGSWINDYTNGPRYWHAVLQENFKLHPVVSRIVKTEGIRPVNWQQLLLEWPHISEDDSMKIAYTRDEKAGADFVENGSTRQTKTSIGKYLARHWPHVPDHTRRDWAALHTVGRMEMVEGIENIIMALEMGPQSCMVSRYGSIPFGDDEHQEMVNWREDPDNNEEPDWSKHPYSVYQPKYGWSMAVHYDGARLVGRALCLTMDEHKIFVRSYIRGETDSCRSETDTELAAWLVTQGFRKERYWPVGTKFDRVEHPEEGGVMMPYLDAPDDQTRRVELRSGYVVRTNNGDYICDNVDGTMTETEQEESIGSCEDCGDTLYENDDHSWVDRSEDTLVCDSCCNSNWSFVRGEGSGYRRSYREYHVNESRAAQVNGQDYYVDTENLPEDVCELENGDYAERDDCVEIDDEYYETDDERVQNVVEEDPDTGSNYALRDACWEDFEGGWHRDDIAQVVLDGEYYTQAQADEVRAEGQLALELETETETEGE